MMLASIAEVRRKKTIVNSQKDTAAAADREAGLLSETDLTQVQQRIIASGTLTVDEMNTFFLKKN